MPLSEEEDPLEKRWTESWDEWRYRVWLTERRQKREAQQELTDNFRKTMETYRRPELFIHTPEEKPKMDGATKAALWLGGIILLIIATIFGLGIWGFIEIVQWITSK